MTYCIKCGVALENNMASCPICGQSVSGGNDIPKGAEKKEPPSFIPPGGLKWSRIKQFLRKRIPAFRRIFHT
jgi:hypothetical protein